MKPLMLGATALVIMFCACPSSAEEGSDGAETNGVKRVGMAHGFTRGVVNVATCWIEVPRKMYQDVNKYPFFGYFSGALHGSYFFVSRACLGVIDIAMFGLTGPSAFDTDFPEYVWNADWSVPAVYSPPGFDFTGTNRPPASVTTSPVDVLEPPAS